ncbi:hypothetical protein AMK59_6690 [Oryctes borbonicus]|uniref:Saccharopine dehydrogenase NADP binding domain-containing protein n=1 Tax=Oryctes borbonicus TaxID=1629725 RepID=A0A0T6AW50_9SCAR|nr:hypothetical protein AMK59_6690 [Oryctes borbonicus]
MSSENRLDIVIFGATGFTGKRTIPQLTKLLKSDNLSLTWGVAGRSEEKLKSALLEMQQKTGEDYSKIPVIIADIDDKESIEKMTAAARMIINTVGPYRFYGERVVEACVKSGTHHVDVSGEPQYMENMELKYHKAAKEKGIYLVSACGFDSIPADMGVIFMQKNFEGNLLKYHKAAKEKGIYLVSACGFDSIPADMGVIFMQKNFEGTLNSVESYMYTTIKGGPYPGATIHYTTYESAVHGIANWGELREIRRKLYPEKLPTFEPKLHPKRSFFKNKFLERWCTIFPGTDRSVCLRTQRYMYEKHRQRPVQVHCYTAYANFFHLMVTLFFGAIFLLMSKLSFTRKLLLAYPRIFTCGMISHEGPTEEKQEHTLFNFVLVGQGWSETQLEPTDQFPTPPEKIALAKVSGNNPGYGATCIMLAVSALMILTEKDKLPPGGGCYPPGAAFANTSMIEKLNKHGVKFEMNPEL